METIGECYGINGKKFRRQYKKSISDFKSWEQKSHAEDWILYPENLSDQLSLDEVALSHGELYTVLTSKKAKGRKGSIVAIIKGTQSEKVIEQILKISRKLRNKVFDQRSTNASAESFNAKIKNFRLQLRGVKDKAFFLFRLSKIFA